MATANEIEDPLIEALPPNTDYITYLTILEYQLTPENLPTLNRLLQEDDGTLASEIGWDLLKIILPILRVNPVQATQCLDIIARRGNPREVIVRVSEELETLGAEESDDEADPTLTVDNIPTFAGEAPHVHLGAMTLAGMPASQKTRPVPQEHEHDEHTPDAAIDELKLRSLLCMLSPLHSRIRTQYPSRFLATSLPAALSAYRRLSMNAESTIAFLDTLTKLSGMRRPNLPPRVPTADLLNQIPESSIVSSAPLLDPESKSESVPVTSNLSESEQAINQRLLQAVLLEVLEEYVTASSEAHPPLTARVRMQHEPQSLSLTRRTELSAMLGTEEVKGADVLRTKFIQVSKSTKIDVHVETAKILEPPVDSFEEEEEEEEEHEYPTSPSQIPIPGTGLLILHSVQVVSQMIDSSTHNPPALSPEPVLQLLNTQYTTDARLRSSGPALDMILSLLFTIFCTSPIPSPPLITSETLFSTFILLKSIFTSNPDPDLRDNAHRIATHLLHAHLPPSARILFLEDLLTSSIPPSPIQEAQSGTLKALAVSWLKDEIYPTTSTSLIMQRNRNEADRGLPKSTLVNLADILFPTAFMPDPPLPKTITTVPNPNPNPNTTNSDEETRESTIEHFSSDLPFYIASLNLVCVFMKNHSNNNDIEQPDTTTTTTTDDPPDTSDTELTPLIKMSTSFLAKMETWSVYLTGRLADATRMLTATASQGRNEVLGEAQMEFDGVGSADIFALEDAVGRAREVVGR